MDMFFHMGIPAARRGEKKEKKGSIIQQALSLFSAERKKALRQISVNVCVDVYVLLC